MAEVMRWNDDITSDNIELIAITSVQIETIHKSIDFSVMLAIIQIYQLTFSWNDSYRVSFPLTVK